MGKSRFFKFSGILSLCLMLTSCVKYYRYKVVDYIEGGFYALTTEDYGVSIDLEPSATHFMPAADSVLFTIRCNPISGCSEFEDAEIGVRVIVNGNPTDFYVQLDYEGMGFCEELAFFDSTYSIEGYKYEVFYASGSFKRPDTVVTNKPEDTWINTYVGKISHKRIEYHGDTDNWQIAKIKRTLGFLPRTLYFTNTIKAPGKGRKEKINAADVTLNRINILANSGATKKTKTWIFDGTMSLLNFFGSSIGDLGNMNISNSCDKKQTFTINLTGYSFKEIKNIVIKNLFNDVSEGDTYTIKHCFICGGQHSFTLELSDFKVYLPTKGVNFYIGGDTELLEKILSNTQFVNGIFDYSDFKFKLGMKDNIW